MLIFISLALILIGIGLFAMSLNYYCDATDLWQFWLSLVFFAVGGVIGIYAFI